MFIWRGWGILVVFIALAALGAGNFAGEKLLHNPDPSNPLSGVALVVAAVATWKIGRYLNNRPSRTVIDKATGRELVLRGSHSLFFVPMEYWGVILGVSAVAVLLYSAVRRL